MAGRCPSWRWRRGCAGEREGVAGGRGEVLDRREGGVPEGVAGDCEAGEGGLFGAERAGEAI